MWQKTFNNIFYLSVRQKMLLKVTYVIGLVIIRCPNTRYDCKILSLTHELLRAFKDQWRFILRITWQCYVPIIIEILLSQGFLT